ncbi:asparaginase [Janibacter melonis]|uniref:asparaginase n=1 Tax=Janibacter melonis TaxID=262209 RepID=UPI00174AF1E8|nr:asparaginase [Janibacter melonis]
MGRTVVITTGGTIASTSDGAGAKVASVSGAALLAGAQVPAGSEIEVLEAFAVNSYDMTFEHMDVICRCVRDALADPAVDGVVVAHGTDTTEETAMLADLLHDDPRPVVLTGAQRSHDEPGTDGPGNLSDALAVAASPGSRGRGVLVCFAGQIHPARGTRKVRTTELDAFADLDHGPLGRVVDGEPVYLRPAAHTPRLVPPMTTTGAVRVDVVALYPGADATALDAHVAAGASGLVLEASGSGNANAVVVEAVARHVGRGVHVVLSTRVPAGPVRPVYGGGGGGVDLVAAGAIPSGDLRPSQARVLLAALLASGASRDDICSAFQPSPSPTSAPADITPAAPSPVRPTEGER